MRTIAFILLCSVLCIGTAEADPAEFIVGIGTHVMGQDPVRNLRMLRELHAKSFRDDLKWQMVEPGRGLYSVPPQLQEYVDGAEATALSPLLVLVYGNSLYDRGGKPVSTEGLDAFNRFASFAATEAARGVRYFEIWNEWDHGPEPKSPESYLALVKRAASALAKGRVKVKVLAGAATTAAIRSGWVERLVRLGVLDDADGVSIHPYVHCDRDNSPEAWAKWLAETARRLDAANGGREVPLYITEMGWPTHRGACGVSPETAAEYAGRALLLARTVPSVRGFWWYDLKNDGRDPDNREQNFGLLGDDYAPKPASAAFRDVAPLAAAASDVKVKPAPGGLKLLAGRDGNGREFFAFWSPDGRKGTAYLKIGAMGAVTILHAGSGRPEALATERSVAVSVDGSPQIVTGASTFLVERFVSSR